jgi:hypothetical protein
MRRLGGGLVARATIGPLFRLGLCVGFSLGFCLGFCLGCGDGGISGTLSDGGAGDAGGGMDSPTSSGSCDPDPLHTGLSATQTGVSVDSFDCSILQGAARYNEPDPMIFKAIIYVESRFDANATACSNMPCGTPTGWTSSETGCYGLMQIVPACGGTQNAPGLLPNGHPNLTKDMSQSTWAGSVFNPDVNISIGIAGVADNRAQVIRQFPGCTQDQYTLMAIGNYNSYGSTRSCTVYNMTYDNLVLQAYRQYSTAANYAAHPY